MGLLCLWQCHCCASLHEMPSPFSLREVSTFLSDLAFQIYTTIVMSKIQILCCLKPKWLCWCAGICSPGFLSGILFGSWICVFLLFEKLVPIITVRQACPSPHAVQLAYNTLGKLLWLRTCGWAISVLLKQPQTCTWPQTLEKVPGQNVSLCGFEPWWGYETPLFYCLTKQLLTVLDVLISL